MGLGAASNLGLGGRSSSSMAVSPSVGNGAGCDSTSIGGISNGGIDGVGSSGGGRKGACSAPASPRGKGFPELLRQVGIQVLKKYM